MLRPGRGQGISLSYTEEEFRRQYWYLSRLISELDELTKAYERWFQYWRELYEFQTKANEALGKSVEVLQNYTNAIGATTKALGDLTTAASRTVETFLSFGKSLVSSSDALSALSVIVSSFSSALSDTQSILQGVSNALNAFTSITESVMKGISQVIQTINSVASSFQTLFNVVGYGVQGISSFLSALKDALEYLPGLGDIEKFANVVFTLDAAFKGITAGLSALQAIIMAGFTRALLPITEFSAQLARISARLQIIVGPMRILSPILESLLQVLSAIGGVFGRIIQSANELVQALAPIQGQVLVIRNLFVGLTSSVGDFVETVSRYGVTLASIMDYLRESVSAGLIPLTSMVETLSSLSYQLSTLAGLRPEEVFTRLAQAVISGNTSLLNQLNIIMTEADLLNIIYQRTGMLLTSIREIPTFLRTRVMMDVIRAEAARVQPSGETLLQFVSELRGIFSTFIARLGEILGTTRDFGLTQQLREALRNLFSPEVVAALRQGLANILSAIGVSLQDLIANLRTFFLSPAFQNLTVVLQGIIQGIGSGFAQVIRMITDILSAYSPQQVREFAVRVGASISAFIQTAAALLFRLFPTFFGMMSDFFTWLSQKAFQVFQLFSLAAQAIIHAANIMVTAITQGVPAATQSLKWGGIGAILAAAAALTIGLAFTGGTLSIPLLLLTGGAGALGALGGGWLGWYAGGGTGVTPQQVQNMKDIIDQLNRLNSQLFGTASGIETLKTRFQEIGRILKEELTGYGERRLRAIEDLERRLSQTSQTQEQVNISFNRFLQIVEPVTEYLRNLASAARDSATLLGTFGETAWATLGNLFMPLSSAFSRLLTSIELSADYVRAAADRYSVILFGAASGARGASMSLAEAFNRLLSAIKEFHDTFTNVTQQLRQMTDTIVRNVLSMVRVGAAVGGLPPEGAMRVLGAVGPTTAVQGAVYVGQQFAAFMEYVRIAREMGLERTPEFLRRVAEFWDNILQSLSSVARVLAEIGQMLLAHSELVREMAVLWGSIAAQLGNVRGITDAIGGIVRSINEYLVSLAQRLAAAITQGNIEEYFRLLRQFFSDIPRIFYEEIPRAAQQMTQLLRRPLDMWMESFNELRGLLQSIGAEGMLFPMAIQAALPALLQIQQSLIRMRDEAFRQGLIPAAMEFNRQLMQTQRQIMEILGLGGMFLPAYTPEQIIRARERMGMLPIQTLMGFLRGQVPMEVPTLRVIPPATLWQLMAYAPGIRGEFGPFISAGQLFSLMPSGLFRGFWDALGFFRQIFPQNIQQQFYDFVRGTTNQVFGWINLVRQSIIEGIRQGMALTMPETVQNILGFIQRNVEAGRIVNATLLVQQAVIQVMRGDVRGGMELMGIARDVMRAPVTVPPNAFLFTPQPSFSVFTPFRGMEGFYRPPYLYPTMAVIRPSARGAGEFSVETPLRIPITFQLTLETTAADGTIRSLTKEIQTIVDINPKSIRVVPA